MAGLILPRGGWFVAPADNFHEPDHGWRRWRGRAVLGLMYTFFRFTTGLSAARLTPPTGFLQAAGFRLVDQRLANFGLVHSDLWQRGKR